MCDGTQSQNYSYFNSTSATPKVDHTYSNEYTIEKESTCSEEGSKSRHCTNYDNCQGKTDVTVIAALPHDYTIHNETSPTCTQQGNNKHFTCKVCTGYFSDSNGTSTTVEAVTIPAKGHGNGTGNKAGYTATYTWTNGSAQSPKCELSLTCKDCSTGLLTNKVLGTDLGVITNGTKVNAACTSTGSQQYIVSGNYTPGQAGSKTYTISNSYQYVIAALGHSYNNNALSTDANPSGLYWYACDNGCGTANPDKTSLYVIKDFTQGQNLELTYESQTGRYNAVSQISLTDALGAVSTPVTIYYVSNTAPSYSRSVVAGNMASFCMPFATDVTGKFEKVYIPAEVALLKDNNICILFQETTGTVAAKTPFIAKIKETGTVVLTSTTGSLDFINPQPQTIEVFNYSGHGGALLQNNDYTIGFGGSVVGKAWMEGLYSMGAQGAFMKMESNGINPYRAYVTKTANTSNAKAIDIFGIFEGDDNDVTAIMNLTTGKVTPVAPTGIYTLEGKRVNSANDLPEGTIYIINGKKVMK